MPGQQDLRAIEGMSILLQKQYEVTGGRSSLSRRMGSDLYFKPIPLVPVGQGGLDGQRGGRQEAGVVVQGRAGSDLHTVMAAGTEESGLRIYFGGRIDKSWQWRDVGGEARQDSRMPPSFLAQATGWTTVPFPEMGKTQGGAGWGGNQEFTF